MAGKKSRLDNPFKSRRELDERKQNTRTEHKVADEKPLIVFSFKDFDDSQCPPGQTFKQWELDGLLSDLFTKLVDLSSKNRIEAEQQKVVKVYGDWPKEHTDYKLPSHIQGEVDWGTIQKIGGQKARVAGYMIENVFYVVFLDKNHKFYKSEK